MGFSIEMQKEIQKRTIQFMLESNEPEWISRLEAIGSLNFGECSLAAERVLQKRLERIRLKKAGYSSEEIAKKISGLIF